MRKENSEFLTGFISEAGSFLTNKDYFAHVQLDDMACWVLANGLDSDKEVRSAELAVKSLLGCFMEKPTMSRSRLKRYMYQAHQLLLSESTRVRLKASLVMIVSDYTKMVWAVAGNARLYHFRNGRLSLRSMDQSLAQRMVEWNQLPVDRLQTHEERDNLLNYLGKPDSFETHVSKPVKLADGDVMLLCSRGLWEGVTDFEITDALQSAKDPVTLTDTLEDVLLSKQRKTVNNYTIAAIFANRSYKEEPKNYWPAIRKAAMIAIPLLLVGGGTYVYMAREAAAKVEAAAGILEHENNGDAYAMESDYSKALKEYSEARNDALRIKDKIHAAMLAKKLRISQLVVDGDSQYKDKDLGKALASYDKALEEAANKKEFNTKEVLEKRDKLKILIQLEAWMKEGDLKLESQDYLAAKELYQQAKKSAIAQAYNDGIKEAQAKIEAADAKIGGVMKETRQLEGDKLERAGDEMLALKDYESAIESFHAAQEIYQAIGLLDKVLGLERKIAKANEKLHPLPKGDGAAPTASVNASAPAASGGLPTPAAASQSSAPVDAAGMLQDKQAATK